MAVDCISSSYFLTHPTIPHPPTHPPIHPPTHSLVTDEQVGAISSSLKIRTFEAGEAVCSKGDPSIEFGIVEVTRLGPEPRAAVVVSLPGLGPHPQRQLSSSPRLHPCTHAPMHPISCTLYSSPRLRPSLCSLTRLRLEPRGGKAGELAEIQAGDGSVGEGSRKYMAGMLFGESALLDKEPRQGTRGGGRGVGSGGTVRGRASTG